MKRTLLFIFVLAALIGGACGSFPGSANQTVANVEVKTPDDGFYQGKGVVTKVNSELGSVEIDHEAIPDLMPAMKMEFSVKDKAMLENIGVGDAVVFTIELKQGAEKIIAIGK